MGIRLGFCLGIFCATFSSHASEKNGAETLKFMLPRGVPLEVVWVPAGTFQMGRAPGEEGGNDREDPQHTVKITAGFWLGKYEVTKAQWSALINTTPWKGQEGVWYHPESPAVFVSWHDAKLFIEELNRHTARTFRLPSEAEREYATRAGTTTRFYWGEDVGYRQVGEYAWYKENTLDIGRGFAHPVGQKLPNPWGLYDMSGNAWEWCEDDFHENYTNAPRNGAPWRDTPRAAQRVGGGGAWDGFGHHLRSAGRRYANFPTKKQDTVGFRVALVPLDGEDPAKSQFRPAQKP